MPAVLQLGVGRAISAARTPQEALDALTRGDVATCSEHTELIGALVTEVIHPPDDQRHTIRRVPRDFVAEWVELLTKVRAELHHTDAQFTVHGVIDMVDGVLRTTPFRAHPCLTDKTTGLSRPLLPGGDTDHDRPSVHMDTHPPHRVT